MNNILAPDHTLRCATACLLVTYEENGRSLCRLTAEAFADSPKFYVPHGPTLWSIVMNQQDVVSVFFH